MEKEKFRKVVYELKERLEITLGTNIETGEIGLKINGIPSSYDISFIKDNRDEIIEVLSEELIKKEIKLELPQEIYSYYEEKSKSNKVKLEDEIIDVLKKFKEEECQR